MDKITQTHIGKLHPAIREEVMQIIRDCDAALTGRAKIRITQGLRTHAEQAKLYAQGRTAPGLKVTNARPGQSIHNYGLAVDICLIIDGKTASWDIAKDWDGDRIADWQECVKIFARYGWEWEVTGRLLRIIHILKRKSTHQIWYHFHRLESTFKNA